MCSLCVHLHKPITIERVVHSNLMNMTGGKESELSMCTLTGVCNSASSYMF